jgi:translation initiation factor 3 subunit A
MRCCSFALQEAVQRQEQENLMKEQESARLAAEEEARKVAAVQAINDKLEKEKLIALMQAAEGTTSAGASGSSKKQDLERFKKMAEEHLDQAALQRAVQEKLLKAKEEEAKKRVEQARRVDYLVRALREAERAKVEALLASTLEADAAYVAAFNSSTLARKRAVYDTAMKIKASIARMLPYADDFEEAVLVKRREEYAKSKVSDVEVKRRG